MGKKASQSCAKSSATGAVKNVQTSSGMLNFIWVFVWFTLSNIEYLYLGTKNDRLISLAENNCNPVSGACEYHFSVNFATVYILN
jgi:hypothetical protein